MEDRTLACALLFRRYAASSAVRRTRGWSCDVGQAVAQLTEAILERDQPRTTDLFFQMVRFPEDVGKGLVANAEALKPTEGEDLVALVTGGSAEACGTG